MTEQNVTLEERKVMAIEAIGYELNRMNNLKEEHIKNQLKYIAKQLK
jgi:hypothetical protein